nr:MAG TPA: hypothetical protein [Caudoviricetes sp.]
MAISKPITRVEQYLAHISGMRVNVPEVPLTREEMYLAAWARKSGIEDTEMQGEPPLTLKDCIGEPFNGLVLYGKSTQVTTTGAQLLAFAVIKGENSGVTLTRKDSVWHLEGTNIADGVRNIRLMEPTEHFKLPAGTYTLSFSKDGVFPIGINISISKVANPDISSEQIWTGIGNAGLNRPTKFTLDGTEEALSIFVNFPAGEYISCDLYVMLNAGNTALPWEPYTGGKPSPSPDYPQEIQSAGDAGNLSVIVKNPDNEQMQSVPFSTPNGLPGIPVSSGGNYTDSNGQQWICDEIDFGRGVYVQRIGVLMLDDKSKILSMSKWDNNHLDVVQPYRVTNFTMSKRKVICDRLPPEEKGEAWSRDIEMIGGVFIKNGTDFYIDFYIKNQRLGTTKDTNPDDAISAALKWLKENPLSCKYALATPIENPLSETDIAAYRALTTYKGTTILESECYLKVKYSKLRK